MTTEHKTERHEIWKIADGLQMDIRAANSKLVELRGRLAQLDLPDNQALTCPDCHARMRGPNTLAEHRYISHNGPEPPHWLHAEAISDEPLEAAEDVDARARATPDPASEVV